MTAIVTGWSPAGFQQYGKKFLETFERHWPADVELVAYVERLEAVADYSRVQQIELDAIAGVRSFIERHSSVPARCGRGAPEYNFRLDAVKFCRQGFIPEHAAQFLDDGEILAWCDADVVSFADVPADFVEHMLGDADVCFLGRGQKHTELGFWAIRLNARSRALVRKFAFYYRSDAVFALKEWHSAFVFDQARRATVEGDGLIERDLTPGGRGHVWFQCELGKYMDHLKGDKRKNAGRSAERPR